MNEKKKIKENKLLLKIFLIFFRSGGGLSGGLSNYDTKYLPV